MRCFHAVLCCIFRLSNSLKKILKWTEGANKTVTWKKRGRLLVNTHTIILQCCWSKVPQTSRINCWDMESSSENRWSTALRLVLVWFVMFSVYDLLFIIWLWLELRFNWRIMYTVLETPPHYRFVIGELTNPNPHWILWNKIWVHYWQHRLGLLHRLFVTSEDRSVAPLNFLYIIICKAGGLLAKLASMRL